VVKVELVLPTHPFFKQIQRQALETSEANLLGRELEEFPSLRIRRNDENALCQTLYYTW